MSGEGWQYIPSGVLEDQARATEGQRWADEQRRQVAGQWAAQEHDWLGRTLQGLGQSVPDLHGLATGALQQGADWVGQQAQGIGQAVGGAIGAVGSDVAPNLGNPEPLRQTLAQASPAPLSLDPESWHATAVRGAQEAVDRGSGQWENLWSGQDKQLANLGMRKAGLEGPPQVLTPAEQESQQALMLAGGMSGSPLRAVQAGGLPSVSPEVDALVKMYVEPPKPQVGGRPFEPGPFEKVRRDWVRAWTDRGIDAAKLQEKIAANTGGNLSESEMMAELQRLDPNKAAEVAIQALRPAIQRVGPDRPFLSAYMTLVQNQEVARAMGQRALEGVLAEPLAPTSGEQAIRSLTSQIRMLTRYRDQAQAAQDLARAADYDQKIASANVRLNRAQKTALRQVSALDAARSARAQATGQAVEQNRQFSGGLTSAESDPGVQAMEQQLGPERMGAIRQSAQEVWDFNQGLLKRRLESGLINSDLYDALTARYQRWSPTVILDYLEGEAQAIGRGKSITVSENGIKAYTEAGTERAREDPLVSTLRNAYVTESAARKNVAFNAFVQLVDRDPQAQAAIVKVPTGEGHIAAEKPVTGFVDGQKVEYLVPDYLRNAVEQEPITPVPYVGPVLGVWRSLVTSRNPAFLTSNALLDASTFMLREMTRGGGPQAAPRALLELMRGYADAFSGLLRGEYRGGLADFYAAGGGMHGHSYITPETGQEALAALGRKSAFTIESKADVLRILKDVATLHPIEAVGERIEQAPRVASYRLALARGQNQTQAVIAGRTVTIDFAQGGRLSKVVNSLIPFFNVNMQAGATLVRAARENPRGMAATALTTLVLPTLAAEAWNRADPQRARDYADVPNYLKDQGIVIMLPVEAPVDRQGNRHPQFLHVRTREFSPFVIGTREIAHRVIGDQPQSWADLLGGTLSAISPFSSADLGGIAEQLTPPGINTAIELKVDRDFYRNRQIATRRADENASPLASAVAPVLGARPSQVEYAARSVGGGPAAQVSEASSALAGKPSQYGAGPAGVPMAGQFAKRFVRGDIGQELELSRQQTIHPETQAALRQAGVEYIPPAVARQIEKVPLLMGEQAQYQIAANREVELGLRRMFANPNWQRLDPAQREGVVKEIVSAAHEKAQAEVLGTIGRSEIRRRVIEQGAHK